MLLSKKHSGKKGRLRSERCWILFGIEGSLAQGHRLGTRGNKGVGTMETKRREETTFGDKRKQWRRK